MKRRDFIQRTTAHTSAAEADALWTALQERQLDANPTTVLNTALEIGVPPSKAEDLARAVASDQQTAEAPAEPEAEPKEEAEPEAEPTPKPKSTNGRRTRKPAAK